FDPFIAETSKRELGDHLEPAALAVQVKSFVRARTHQHGARSCEHFLKPDIPFARILVRNEALTPALLNNFARLPIAADVNQAAVSRMKIQDFFESSAGLCDCRPGIAMIPLYDRTDMNQAMLDPERRIECQEPLLVRIDSEITCLMFEPRKGCH